jgi:hypothetical protein
MFFCQLVWYAQDIKKNAQAEKFAANFSTVKTNASASVFIRNPK